MNVISLSDHACTCAQIHQGLFGVCARMVSNLLAMALVNLKVTYSIHFQIFTSKKKKTVYTILMMSNCSFKGP